MRNRPDYGDATPEDVPPASKAHREAQARASCAAGPARALPAPAEPGGAG